MLCTEAQYDGQSYRRCRSVTLLRNYAEQIPLLGRGRAQEENTGTVAVGAKSSSAKTFCKRVVRLLSCAEHRRLRTILHRNTTDRNARTTQRRRRESLSKYRIIIIVV